MLKKSISYSAVRSLSARRAWIEMANFAGSDNSSKVALRKESVDRNHAADISARREAVALRKESVDRNIPCGQLPTPEPPSLSARRAWIEIANFCRNRFCPTVALRKESVDRNCLSPSRCGWCLSSLSARRAWIEIRYSRYCRYWLGSLSARRAWIEMLESKQIDPSVMRRSPQGERG